MVRKYVRRGGRPKRQLLASKRQGAARARKWAAMRYVKDMRPEDIRRQRAFSKQVLRVVNRNKERRTVDTDVQTSGTLTYGNPARVVAVDSGFPNSATDEYLRIRGMYWVGSVFMSIPNSFLTTSQGRLQLDVFMCTREGNDLPTAGDFPAGDDMPDWDYWRINRIKVLKHTTYALGRQEEALAVERAQPVRLYANIARRLRQDFQDSAAKTFRTFIVFKVTGFDAGDTAKVVVKGDVRVSHIDV